MHKIKVLTKALLSWAFCRFLGLRDIKYIFKAMKTRKSRKDKTDGFWGTITIEDDRQVLSRIDWQARGGMEAPPRVYSTRVFYGTEDKEGKSKEYWVGIRASSFLPLIPIPICVGEIVIKAGPTDELWKKAINDSYGNAGDLFEYSWKWFHKIIEEATVRFRNNNIDYENDAIWSSY